MSSALGFIETYGMIGAIEAADAACKAANVSIVDCSRTKGGQVSITISGDVGAVKAAIDAANTAASRISTVVSTNVIPRASDQVSNMIFATKEQVSSKNDTKKKTKDNVDGKPNQLDLDTTDMN